MRSTSESRGRSGGSWYSRTGVTGGVTNSSAARLVGSPQSRTMPSVSDSSLASRSVTSSAGPDLRRSCQRAVSGTPARPAPFPSTIRPAKRLVVVSLAAAGHAAAITASRFGSCGTTRVVSPARAVCLFQNRQAEQLDARVSDLQCIVARLLGANREPSVVVAARLRSAVTDRYLRTGKGPTRGRIEEAAGDDCVTPRPIGWLGNPGTHLQEAQQ